MASITTSEDRASADLPRRPEQEPVAGGPVGSPYDTDVLIVGLGPVGTALANLLGRYGVRVVAIGRSSESR